MGRYPKTIESSDGDGGANKTKDTPDYSAVDLPQKPPSEYTYVERRAEILEQIQDLGTPDALNRGELAERYQVSQPTLTKDLERLGGHIRETFDDRDRRSLRVDTVVRRSVQGLLDDEQWHKAASVAMDYEQWLTERRDLERLEARLDALEADREADADSRGGRR